ncbi:MAG: carbamoyltransferase [Tannerella sp.]|jgi:carbamoyltransferase|nr:carbamoyltransferase [Tannerella sp.]
MEVILGISAYYHDSAAALLVDGKIVAAAQEERFSRRKHDASFPARAIACVLQEAGLKGSDVCTVTFYEKPFLKFERLLETCHAFAPRGLRNFMRSMPVWIKDKLYMKQLLRKELRKLQIEAGILFSEHHLSHAASAFYPSPFETAAILTVDGVGEWATATICRGEDTGIRLLRELNFPHSPGLLYSAFTYYCGFEVNGGEYKLMGLAPYGRHSPAAQEYIRLIKKHLVDIRDDGSFLLNMDYFAYTTGLRMIYRKRWERLFGFPARSPESALGQQYMDLAYAIQQVTEEILLLLAATAKRLTGCRQLVMAGGVALNCVANGKILRSALFDDVWIQPAAGDDGGALGAALATWYIGRGKKRTCRLPDDMEGALLGPAFSDRDVQRLIRRTGARAVRLDDDGLKHVASLLAGGYIVGWFQGRMEYGPRALGNRSILADARHAGMQQKLNREIKFRENFRPFAPSVLEEDAHLWFDLHPPSPYMLVAAEVNASCRLPLSGDEERLPYPQVLYRNRSLLQAVTHVDYTARIQTVSKKSNPRYHALLEHFKALTGCGVLVNTSFNVRDEPIVCTPEDAYRCFMHTGMDFLVMENWLFSKENG